MTTELWFFFQPCWIKYLNIIKLLSSFELIVVKVLVVLIYVCFYYIGWQQVTLLLCRTVWLRSGVENQTSDVCREDGILKTLSKILTIFPIFLGNNTRKIKVTKRCHRTSKARKSWINKNIRQFTWEWFRWGYK